MHLIPDLPSCQGQARWWHVSPQRLDKVKSWWQIIIGLEYGHCKINLTLQPLSLLSGQAQADQCDRKVAVLPISDSKARCLHMSALRKPTWQLCSQHQSLSCTAKLSPVPIRVASTADVPAAAHGG